MNGGSRKKRSKDHFSLPPFLTTVTDVPTPRRRRGRWSRWFVRGRRWRASETPAATQLRSTVLLTHPISHQVEGARVCKLKADQVGIEEVKTDDECLSRSYLYLSDIIVEGVPHASLTNIVWPTHDPVHPECVALNLELSINRLWLKLFSEGARDALPRVRRIESCSPFASPAPVVKSPA